MEFLARLGIPAALIARLEKWESRSPKVTGVGIEGAWGTGLPDAEYVKAWKELRGETVEILEGLRKYLPAQADVSAEVFESRRPSDWTGEKIAEWRRQKQRELLIMSYGSLLGVRHADAGGEPPAEEAELPVPYPKEFLSEDDRRAFHRGFSYGAHLRVPVGEEEPTLAELERKLGVQ